MAPATTTVAAESSAEAARGERTVVAAVSAIVCVSRSRRERAEFSSLDFVANRGDEADAARGRFEHDGIGEKASASFASEISNMLSAADFMVVCYGYVHNRV